MGQTLKLKGFSFQQLHTAEGLHKLDESFLAYLRQLDELLHGQLLNYRQGNHFSAEQISELIIQCGPILEAFIAELFAIEDAVGRLQAATVVDDPIFAFKKYFVLREAKRLIKKAGSSLDFNKLNQWVKDKLKENKLTNDDDELAIAKWGQMLLADANANREQLEQLTLWCVAAITTPQGQALVKNWVSFHFPEHLNYENLVKTVPVPNDPVERLEGPHETWRMRDGFNLTDHRMSRREALDHIHYCVYCHKTDGDFCSKGFPVKKGDPKQGLKVNPLDETLTGCPLDEKISEMHMLKKAGYGVAALATVMIDNPMCPATGHRICNDCMKACIYQKQEPVNIPQTETRILTDVLDLPWGVEIYDLLTRWNPLRRTQWVTKPYNGKKVLVMGMGPAGFTLAHYLLMEGFAVVGTDGLKIEPLPVRWQQEPIYQYADLKENLDSRVMAGFGGVAEYGITVRWDKNFLKLIYINLMRRQYFQVFGSVRFGGTIKVEDAWTLGFDHLAIAVGAGLPRELPIPHSMAPGMRQANDFLMALQLTGAAKPGSIANLQVRLPAVVIGGGLTGIDTATEVQAYYILQVEKIYKRYHQLIKHFGSDTVREQFDEYSLQILDEFLDHGQAVLEERQRAQQEKRLPNFIALIRQWGGVTIAYRRMMQESPAYKRNHEEVSKALEEGIYYAEGLEPKVVKLDEHGQVMALECAWQIIDEEGSWKKTDEMQSLPARSIFVATGAKPNIAYEFEHRGTFLREGFDYQSFELVDNQLEQVHPEHMCKTEHFGAFTSYNRDRHYVTFLGDTNPVFHGSVVKAIASGKRVYPQIVKAIINHDQPPPGDPKEYARFKQQMTNLFSATVVSVRRHTPDMVELQVRAPMAARNLYPGQFYRLQNYECLSPMVGDTLLQTEAMAMIGARHPDDADVISLMVIERGASSRVVATFEVGQQVALMGPTGCKARIPTEGKKTVMIIGGSMAAAHLRSMGPALKKFGHQVIFVSLMRTANELYCQKELEAASDKILWLTDNGSVVEAHRKQDIATHGELIATLRQYADKINLSAVDEVMVVGSAELIRRVQQARAGLLKTHFAKDCEFVASVYGPMQCMLKGVCAQCLQWQIDPKTGQRTKAVYACSWQHQPMQVIDINNIDERLSQNRVEEILTNLWLDYLFATEQVARV
jgi:NADPH-dependent glutamate synthase beta subunit-like oxidoreductase/NAD(P)H-flavin reductase